MDKPNKKQKLTPKQDMFCKEYLIDLNATQAAIRSGYSEKTARQIATRLLSKVYIQERIQQLMDKRATRTAISADSILEKIETVVEMCMACNPILDRDGNATGEMKFKEQGALKGLELLGRHKKLFVDKVEHSGHIVEYKKDLDTMTEKDAEDVLKGVL